MLFFNQGHEKILSAAPEVVALVNDKQAKFVVDLVQALVDGLKADLIDF